MGKRSWSLKESLNIPLLYTNYKNINDVQWKYQDYIYNFVLEEYHTLNVNGYWCITLGHDFKGKGIEHEFYGNSKMIDKYLRTSQTYPVCVFDDRIVF